MSVKVNFSLAKMARATPKIMAQLLNDVGALVITDTIKGAQRGVDQSNRPFTPLNPKTIAAKSRKGSSNPRRPLWDTGRMIEGMFLKTKATPAKLRAVATLAMNRMEIGIFHQTGDGNPERVWFPKKATPRIIRSMLPLLRSVEAKIAKSVK